MKIKVPYCRKCLCGLFLYTKNEHRQNRCRSCLKKHKAKYDYENPWITCLNAARGRCRNKFNHAYEKYGARGIQCMLSIEEIKELWMRDGADGMDVPTIDRIDPDGDYKFSNCRFVEKTFNSSRRRNPYTVCIRGKVE